MKKERGKLEFQCEFEERIPYLSSLVQQLVRNLSFNFSYK
jgi:hypothetical protein